MPKTLYPFQEGEKQLLSASEAVANAQQGVSRLAVMSAEFAEENAKLRTSITRLLTALDGMDRGCTEPGFRGHQNGYGEESAGDELQAAREELASLMGHIAAVEVEEPESN